MFNAEDYPSSSFYILALETPLKMLICGNFLPYVANNKGNFFFSLHDVKISTSLASFFSIILKEGIS